MKKILFICHGNICRSPMAEFVCMDMVRKRGLEEKITADSAAISSEETGNPVHHGTVKKLREVGVPMWDHRARKLTKKDYEAYDLLIGMEESNRRAILRIVGGDPAGKVHLLLDYSRNPRDIPDPWYTGKFDPTYRDICEGCEALLDDLCRA